jgi:hypothetical protein
MARAPKGQVREVPVGTALVAYYKLFEQKRNSLAVPRGLPAQVMQPMNLAR